MCFLSVVTRILIVLFGILLPARNTQMALGDEMLLLWGKYWVVFACLFTIELLMDTFFSWLPLYVESKMLIVLWLVASAPQASVWIYDTILSPLLIKHKRRIDYFLQHGKRHLLSDFFSYIAELWLRVVNYLKPLISRMWYKKHVMSAMEQNFYETGEEDNVDAAPGNTEEEEQLQLQQQELHAMDNHTNSYTKPNYVYAKSVEEKFYKMGLPSKQSRSHSHIKYGNRSNKGSKQSLPELARKALDSDIIDGTSTPPLGRSMRKQYVYDPQFEDYNQKTDQMMNMDMNTFKGHHSGGIELTHCPFPPRQEQRRNQ